MTYSKAYPYLKATLDALIEAAPNWAKAPAKFVSSLSEQLKEQGEENNKQLEEVIKSISENELREIIKEVGCDRKYDIEFIVEKVNLIPDILRKFEYRFDNVDERLEEIKGLLMQDQSKIKTENQKAQQDIYNIAGDAYFQSPVKEKSITILSHSLHNQTPPEKDFVGRKEMLETITGWYRNPEVRIGALIGWGGVGKSALVRKWYDDMGLNGIKPDGVFWWGFYDRNASLEQFLNALLRYVGRGQIDPDTIKSTWEKTDRIMELIHWGRYLIILDGIEEMQKPETGDGFGRMMHHEFTELLHYLTDVPNQDGLCLITTRYSLKDIDEWHGRGYENLQLVDLDVPDALLMLRKRGVKGSDEDVTVVINRYKGQALSLTLLAGYLMRYYDGDVKHAPEIEFVLGDTKRFEDVNKLLHDYRLN